MAGWIHQMGSVGYLQHMAGVIDGKPAPKRYSRRPFHFCNVLAVGDP